MPNQAFTGNPVPHGYNNTLLRAVEANNPGAVSDTETIDVTLPDGMPKDMLPVAAVAYTDATPAVKQDLVITNHNRTTGVTRLTAGTSGVASGAKIRVLYADA